MNQRNYYWKCVRFIFWIVFLAISGVRLRVNEEWIRFVYTLDSSTRFGYALDSGLNFDI